MNEEFWKRLNSILKQKGLTQKKLSVLCGFQERRLENLSYLKNLPTLIEAIKIAKCLDTTVEYLVTGESPPVENAELSKTEIIKEYLISLIDKLN